MEFIINFYNAIIKLILSLLEKSGLDTSNVPGFIVPDAEEEEVTPEA